MILKDFSISLKQFLDREKGSERAERLQLQRAMFSVTELYLRLLGRRVRTTDTAKVFVELTDGENVGEIPHVQHALHVLLVSWSFDITGYREASPQRRKELTLELLKDVLFWIADREGWDKHPFREAYEQAVALGISNEYFWKNGKAWQSPDRKRKSRLLIDFGAETIDISVVLFDRGDREIERKLMIRMPAAEAEPDGLLKECEWISNRVFRIKARYAPSSAGRDRHWDYQVEEGSPK